MFKVRYVNSVEVKVEQQKKAGWIAPFGLNPE